MKKDKYLSDKDKKTQQLVKRYEKAQKTCKPIYLDSDEILDVVSWYATHLNDEKAYEAVKYGLKLHPDCTELLAELGNQYLDHDDLESARRIDEQISEPDMAEAIILKARLKLKEGKEDEADQLFKKLEPYNLSNIVDVVDTYLNNGGSLEKAEEWLKRGFERYDSNPLFVSLAADFYYNDGQLDKAIEYYNKAIDADPYNESYWCELAHCYFEKKQYDKAIDACEYALISDDSYAEAHLLAGQSYLELGNTAESLKHFGQIIEQDILPESIYLFIEGLALINKKKWKEAYQYMERSLHCSGHDSCSLSSVYENAAICLHRMGDEEKAELYFGQAVEQTPENSELRYTFGRFYMEISEPEKALEQWELAIKLEPQPDELDSVASYCIDYGLLEYARKVLEILESVNPKYPRLQERLAVLCMLADDDEEFRRHCQLSSQRKRLEKLHKEIFKMSESTRQLLIDLIKSGEHPKEL